MAEYALYKADELAEFQKVKCETILFYATPSYRKRTSEKGIRTIRLEKEE